MTEKSLRAGWYALGEASLIPPGEGRTFRVGNLEVAVFRSRSGQVFATQAVCPHEGGCLSEGILGGATVVCPMHGYKFDLVSGINLNGEIQPLKVYPSRLDDAGRILIDLSVASI